MECRQVNANTITINGNTHTLGTWPCTFAGEVDVMIDTEILAALWVCPTCEWEHDISKEWYS